MAANAKYTPAPQRDSFEEANYTQAPPSYQAESSNANPDIFAGPREDDDNVPDDFKYGGSVAEATLPIRMQFVRKVYSILFVPLQPVLPPHC